MNGYSLNTYSKPPMTKSPPQHKQSYYYIFWSIATIAVVLGQINVSLSYNRLSDSLEYIIIEQARTKINKTAN